MPGAVELRIPPQPEHLALVRLVVERTAAVGASLPPRRVDDLRLAVSEACANALDALSAVGSDAPVEICIEPAERSLSVTVTDHAGGFDLDALEPIPPATHPARLRHERGLGISIMRSLVDEVAFTRTADGTAVRLVVRG